MFYAERLGDHTKGEPYIAERGIFLSIEEFLPFREKGWRGTEDTNEMADRMIIENTVGESLEDMGLEEHFEETREGGA